MGRALGMKNQYFPRGLQCFAHQFEDCRRKQRFRIQMQRYVVHRFAAPESLGDHKPLVFVPLKCRFARGFFRLRSRSVQQPIDMIPQGASSRRLQTVAVGRKHFVERISGGEHDLGNQPRVLSDQFRRQNVLEFVGKFAEFAKTASGGIAF